MYTHGHVAFLSLASLDNTECWYFIWLLLCACHLPVASWASDLAIAEMLALAAVQYSVLLAPELGISELSIFLQPVLDGRSSLQCKWRQLAKWLRRWW